ncbi:flagellar hook-associated protein FlgK [Vibrio sp.]|nr:flagellar hook-associated protein FlgK [Vibrio sp.]
MSMLNIASTGLNANRVSLNTTAQNIANVNTEGYSRQDVLLSSIAGQYDEPGRGVQVSSIRRITEDYLTKQLWQSSNLSANANSFHQYMASMEGIIGSDSIDLSSGINAFISSAHELTVRPESLAYRQQMLSSADSLAQKFNLMSQAINNQHQTLSSDRTTIIDDINGQVANIASYNSKIIELSNLGENTAILEDKRDVLIKELSENVSITTVYPGDGSIEISLPNGEPLVMKSSHATVVATPLASDPFQATISISLSGQSFPVSSGEIGGRLGAIENMQNTVILPSLDVINDMARELADEVNGLLLTGTDLNGNTPGAALFTYTAGYEAESFTTSGITAQELALSIDGTLGDGSLAEAIAAVEKTDFSISGYGTMTLSEAFAVLTGNIAISAQQAVTEQDANQILLNQAVASRDAVSGVNSDEEAANLIKYTNNYNANMKVISTANTLFNSILNAF